MGTQRITRVMSSPPLVVDSSVAANWACDVAERNQISHLLIEDTGALVGIACTCQLWDLRREAIAAAMTRPVVTVDAAATVGDAALLVRERCIGCLPVVDRGRVVGVVTRGDLARAGALDLADRRCVSCGSHHHLRRAQDDTPFCVACLDRARLASELGYVDLGGGD
jgi:CBS domain-containing protein